MQAMQPLSGACCVVTQACRRDPETYDAREPPDPADRP